MPEAHACWWCNDAKLAHQVMIDVSYMECFVCGASGPIVEGGEEAAIAAWNRRADRVQEVEAGWQPIETAPTNTSVLVFVPNTEHYGEGIWRAILVDMGTGRRWASTGLHVGRDIAEGWTPTHWRQLPAPPGAALAGKENAADADS